MKFLCVPCDKQMKLSMPDAPDRGSMTMLYECPSCSHRIAMMTNPFETEAMDSIGVLIGGKSVSQSAAPSGTVSKRPITSVAAGVKGADSLGGEVSQTIEWTPQALARLQNIPEFVRPMAKKGIEKMALERDYSEISEKVLDEAKDFFGM